MESFFNINNFKSRKKVTESFFSIKNLKSHKAVMEFFLSFKSFKSRKNVTEPFFQWSRFIKLSYDAQISRNNIFSVSSHWISFIITF